MVNFINDDKEDKMEYIKNNLVKLAKTCLLEEKCESDKNVTIEDLKLNNYIDSSFDKDLSEFSLNSYVTPDGEAYLFEK